MKKTAVHVLMGSQEDYKDHTYLAKHAQSGKPLTWSAVAKLKKGDRVLIYLTKPHGSFVATAIALEDAYRTHNPDDYPFRTSLGEIKMTIPSVLREDAQRIFPHWKWVQAKGRFGRTTIDPALQEVIWNEFLRFSNGRNVPGEQLPSRTGSGYGDAESNKKVETAAIDHVLRTWKAKGFKVTSREAEKVGYDLEVQSGKERWHVEVKGTSGSEEGFILTENEYAQARSDPKWLLEIVINALDAKKRRILAYAAKDLEKHFSKRAIQYQFKKLSR